MWQPSGKRPRRPVCAHTRNVDNYNIERQQKSNMISNDYVSTCVTRECFFNFSNHFKTLCVLLFCSNCPICLHCRRPLVGNDIITSGITTWQTYGWQINWKVWCYTNRVIRIIIWRGICHATLIFSSLTLCKVQTIFANKRISNK